MQRIWPLLLGFLIGLGPAQASLFLDKSVDDWLRALEKASTPQARRAAVYALGRTGQAGSRALDDLARCLRDERDSGVREMAADSIGAILLCYPEPPSSAWDRCGAALLKAANDSNERVRRSAIYALGAFATSDTRPVLREALNDDSPEVRRNAAWGLGRLAGEADPASLRGLRLRLRDEDALVRRDVAQALMNISKSVGRTKLEDMGEPLFQMARDDRDLVARKAALAALAAIASPAHSPLAPFIEPLLRHRDTETAQGAAFALAAIGGRAAESALPVLRQALKDRDPAVQALAAAGIESIGPPAAVLVDDLAETLTNARDPVVRRNCAIALGQIGSDAREGVPALAKALRVRAPLSSQPDGQRLEDEVRYHVAEALSHIRYPANEAALEAVREAISRDPNPDVRLRCIEALFQIREVTVFEKWNLHTTLRKVLDETAPDSKLVRYNAARLLAAIYTDTAPDKATTVLLQMLTDTTIRIFYESRANIEGGTTEAGTGTTGVSARTGGSARFLAAEALGWMGSKSKKNSTVMDALRKASTDSEKKLAETARETLRLLGD
jgi:HEAT repeat protein